MTAVPASQGHGVGHGRQCVGHTWDGARHRGTGRRTTATSLGWSMLLEPLTSPWPCLQFTGEETEAGEAVSSCHGPKLTHRRERRDRGPPSPCLHPRRFQLQGFFCLLRFLILSLFLWAHSLPPLPIDRAVFTPSSPSAGLEIPYSVLFSDCLALRS